MDDPGIQAVNASHNKVDAGDGEDWQWRWCMERELGVRSRTTMGWVEDKELIIKIKKIHACYVMKVDLTAIK